MMKGAKSLAAYFAKHSERPCYKATIRRLYPKVAGNHFSEHEPRSNNFAQKRRPLLNDLNG